MAIKINQQLTARKLLPRINRLFELSAEKLSSIEKNWNVSKGTPVFTMDGKYTSRGWTEWTQGFQFGSALLQFDASGERKFLELGRSRTVQYLATHVSHVGVHDHGFNNVSTYGNLWRLMREDKINFNEHELEFYELALKVSGAVQASRWTEISLLDHGSPLPRERSRVRANYLQRNVSNGGGYIHSFNGPHSLFVDTMRSLRALALSHQLGHVLMGEGDRKISLLQRLIQHGTSTARYNIYYGEGRDIYDQRGRTAHESIFNLNDGSYRCPSTQQGYSPFSTWTRGLAWAILGYAEQLEFFEYLSGPRGQSNSGNSKPLVPRSALQIATETFQRAALATAEFYLENVCADGVPMWDTGAPNLHRLGDYLSKPSNPFNKWEPVDSSAAAIASQGLLRLAHYLNNQGEKKTAQRYHQAGITVAQTLFEEPYLSTSPKHQGLLLHSVYHRPNGWDRIAKKQAVPNGESSMWGDYHLRELALYLFREAKLERYLAFFVAND